MMQKLKKELPWVGFILPAFICYTVLTVVPLVQTVGLSFTDWNGYAMTNLHFVGLKNFLAVLTDKAMSQTLKNTIVYSIIFPIVATFIAIPLACVLNSKMRTRNLQRAVFFFPSVPSAIILGYLWAYILAPTASGLINKFLGVFGVTPVMWLAKPHLAMLCVFMVNLWSVVGWHACIYLAALQGIPKDYYEAASIDGATIMQQFKSITLPMLKPAMTTSVMLLLLNSLKLFDLPFALTSGGPGNATMMISQMIIKTGFVEKSYGKATAMSTIFLIFIVIASVIQLKLMKSQEED